MKCPLGKFCPACQAIPQAGYCNLAGCPSAPDRQLSITDDFDLVLAAFPRDYGVSVPRHIDIAARRALTRIHQRLTAANVELADYARTVEKLRAFPQPKKQTTPCGECHLPAGETCDICGAAR